MTAIDDAAMEGHGDGGETGGGDNGLSDPTDVGTSAAASAPMPPPSAAAAAAPAGRRRRAHTAKKGAHFTPDLLAAVRARLLEDRRAHASTRTKECRVSPAQTIARWPRPSAGAAPDFRYPPYDINALAFSSPAHSIRWAVKVSRATAPGFGSYVGV